MKFFFFFSSRRRHTRWNCDWSSDVCSSDLPVGTGRVEFRPGNLRNPFHGRGSQMSYTEPLRHSTTEARARKLGRFSFAFGPRFFVALLLGLVALGPAWWFRQAIAAMFLWDGVVLGAWLWDLLRLPRPEQLEVQRTWEKRPCLGVPGN